VILFGFQFLILRRPIPNTPRVLFGFLFVLLGLTLFLVGLEQALFPIGRLMAEQLTAPDFLRGTSQLQDIPLVWIDYYWVLIFAFSIGFLIRKILQPNQLFSIIRCILPQTNSPKRNCHGYEPYPIPTRLVLACVPYEVWHR